MSGDALLALIVTRGPSSGGTGSAAPQSAHRYLPRRSCILGSSLDHRFVRSFVVIVVSRTLTRNIGCASAQDFCPGTEVDVTRCTIGDVVVRSTNPKWCKREWRRTRHDPPRGSLLAGRERSLRNSSVARNCGTRAGSFGRISTAHRSSWAFQRQNADELVEVIAALWSRDQPSQRPLILTAYCEQSGEFADDRVGAGCAGPSLASFFEESEAT